ncbi:unnamed protein product [Didymodactylos carnosus]|uniref:MULE transposase domain-containing protein n=1 Tax=Didymodactylos carnosus TaxID=1234261 RepID=A0A814KEE8_9BILA|nr:unnamed protein product [Didymodactylos carnosus]CAF3817989.1 unnamed protein product [Didymodactylos carnosus]
MSCAVSPTGEMSCAVSPTGEMSCAVSPTGEMSCAVSPTGEMSCAVSSTGEMSCAVSPTGEMSCAVSPVGEMSCAVSAIGEVSMPFRPEFVQFHQLAKWHMTFCLSKSAAAGGLANIEQSQQQQQLPPQTNVNSNNKKKKQTLKAAVSVQPAIDKVQAGDEERNMQQTVELDSAAVPVRLPLLSPTASGELEEQQQETDDNQSEDELIILENESTTLRRNTLPIIDISSSPEEDCQRPTTTVVVTPQRLQSYPSKPPAIDLKPKQRQQSTNGSSSTWTSNLTTSVPVSPQHLTNKRMEELLLMLPSPPSSSSVSSVTKQSQRPRSTSTNSSLGSFFNTSTITTNMRNNPYNVHDFVDDSGGSSGDDEDEVSRKKKNDEELTDETLVGNGKQTWSIVVGPIIKSSTKRGSDSWIMEDYSYIKMTKGPNSNGYMPYRCQERNKRCTAVIYIDPANDSYVDHNDGVHYHPPNGLKMKKSVMVHDLKSKAKDISVNIPAAADKALVDLKLTDEEMVQMPLPKSVARSAYRSRQQLFPPLPTTQKFDLPDRFTKTVRGEPFILYDGFKTKYGGRLTIFTKDEFLEYLTAAELVLVDGTFGVVPAKKLGFDQLVVIMGKVGIEGVSLAWALTSNRKQETYDKIWSVIKKWASEHHTQMNVKRFILDCEHAQINSIEKYFHSVEITLCWLHHVKCLLKHVGKEGLITSYKKDPTVRLWIRSFMALPLVDNSIFPIAIEYLRENRPDDIKCLEWLRYWEHQWLVTVPPQYWHVGNYNPRSNNWIEGYNNRLGNRFGNHPNMWLFMHHLLIEEQVIHQRLQQLEAGKIKKSGSTVAGENDRISKLIDTLNEKYINGEYTVDRYLSACTHLVGNADVGASNANRIAPLTVATIPVTTSPPSKKRKKTTTTKRLQSSTSLPVTQPQGGHGKRSSTTAPVQDGEENGEGGSQDDPQSSGEVEEVSDDDVTTATTTTITTIRVTRSGDSSGCGSSSGQGTLGRGRGGGRGRKSKNDTASRIANLSDIDENSDSS